MPKPKTEMYPTISKQRLEKIFDNLIAWGLDHDDEFMSCMVSAMDLTPKEVKQLDLGEWVY